MSLQTTIINAVKTAQKIAGSTGAYRNITVTGIDPTTGAPTQTTVDKTMDVIESSFNAFEKAINAGLQVGDFYVIVRPTANDGTAISPSNDDFFVVGGKEYPIFDFDIVKFGDGPVMYKLYLRG